MAIGTITRLGTQYFGFIKDDDAGAEHFFHINQTQPGVELRSGDRVTFEVEQNPTQPGKTRARDVRLLV